MSNIENKKNEIQVLLLDDDTAEYTLEPEFTVEISRKSKPTVHDHDLRGR